MKTITVTAATDYPVSIADAREQCAILDDDSHDVLLSRLIRSATKTVEAELEAVLMTQTLRVEFDGFPSGDLVIPVYPVQSITSVAYDDENDVEQTLVDGTDYWSTIEGQAPRLVAIESWPATKARKPGSVRITITAGYADQAAVPEDIRHAILIKVAELFMHREEAVVGMSVTPTQNTIKRLLTPHRRRFV